ncbi:MAG TPA: hypothetical protein VL793_03255 [Patescibacteria group bacterium]|jgi:hypothetical protein|nr:hypothetical protein [Patescibacteria group bacterium]
MPAANIANTVVDEVNHRTYVILAPRVLTDGELYRAIRQEILRRGGRPLAQGETLTLTVTSSGGVIGAAARREPSRESLSLAAPQPDASESIG